MLNGFRHTGHGGFTPGFSAGMGLAENLAAQPGAVGGCLLPNGVELVLEVPLGFGLQAPGFSARVSHNPLGLTAGFRQVGQESRLVPGQFGQSARFSSNSHPFILQKGKAKALSVPE